MKMTNEQYHADTSHISASGIKLFMRSPAHYWSAYLDPARKPQEPTQAMQLGTAVHTAVLEPMLFDDQYIVMPDIDRRTKEGKAAYAELLATGKEVLAAEDCSNIQSMAASFHGHETTRDLFAHSHIVEHSLFAAINGVKCKARPDFMLLPVVHKDYPGGLIVDLKSTTDASADEFGRQSWNLSYHIQAALYRRVYQAVYGVLPKFLFGAVESKPPYLVAYYCPPDELLDYADCLIDEVLALYASCLEFDRWPGYPTDTTALVVPGYARRMMENSDDDIEVSYV